MVTLAKAELYQMVDSALVVEYLKKVEVMLTEQVLSRNSKATHKLGLVEQYREQPSKVLQCRGVIDIFFPLNVELICKLQDVPLN